jgi:hypothetical protein
MKTWPISSVITSIFLDAKRRLGHKLKQSSEHTFSARNTFPASAAAFEKIQFKVNRRATRVTLRLNVKFSCKKVKLSL